MTLDILTYLPDDILCKVDRAAMAVSLETRVPFLDHKVVEFARRLPLGLKLRGGKGKWIVRQALKRHVPEGLFDRPKMGFGVPIEEWLRGDLKDWGASLLTKSRLQQQGYLEAAPVLKKWNEHQKSVNNWDAQLWAVLMFEAWVDAF